MEFYSRATVPQESENVLPAKVAWDVGKDIDAIPYCMI